jgi:tetratricopeptide (TPR) repeat protein
MKKTAIIFLVLLQSLVGLASPQEGFEAGNAAYLKEDFARAASEYEKVLNGGSESAELHFNLANSYYKLNKVGPAIYHYEKALLLCPADRDIKANLAFAQKMMIDEVRPDNRVGFEKAVAGFTSNMNYDGWAKVSVLFAFLIFVMFAAYYFSRTALLKRIFFILMLVCVLATIISLTAAYTARTIYNSERPAIVFGAVVGVKSEPKFGSADAFVLHEGTKVFILEELGEWNKITLADGTDGWIEKSQIKPLK